MGEVSGPFTVEEIDGLIKSRKVGLAHEVNYRGEWILLEEFKINLARENEQKLIDSKEQKRREESERIREEENEKQKLEAEKLALIEQQKDAEHRRQLEIIQAQQPPPPFPPNEMDGEEPQAHVNNQGQSSRSSSGEAGFGVFVIVVLTVLWYQGYWDPGDIKALWGESKYIEVVKQSRVENGETRENFISRRSSEYSWESRRGESRKNIYVILKCTINDNGESEAINAEWLVNKSRKTIKLVKMSINGRHYPIGDSGGQ